MRLLTTCVLAAFAFWPSARGARRSRAGIPGVTRTPSIRYPSRVKVAGAVAVSEPSSEPTDYIGSPGPGWCVIPNTRRKADGHGSLHTFEVESEGLRSFTRQKGPVRICREHLMQMLPEVMRRGTWGEHRDHNNERGA